MGVLHSIFPSAAASSGPLLKTGSTMDGINPMAPWVVDAGREPMATHGFVNNRQVSNRGQQ
jgi:hypothetical protein